MVTYAASHPRLSEVGLRFGRPLGGMRWPPCAPTLLGLKGRSGGMRAGPSRHVAGSRTLWPIGRDRVCQPLDLIRAEKVGLVQCPTDLHENINHRGSESGRSETPEHINTVRPDVAEGLDEWELPLPPDEIINSCQAFRFVDTRYTQHDGVTLFVFEYDFRS